MRRRHFSCLGMGIAAALLASCGAPASITAPGGGDEDPPPAPETVRPEAAIAPMMGVVESTGVSFVAPLASGDVLYVQGSDVVLWRLPPEPAARVGAAADVGTIHDVAVVAGAIVLATELGLRVVEAEGILASPLAAALDGAVPTALAASRADAVTPELWMLSEDTLHLWRDGAVHAVSIDGVGLAGARIAHGAPIADRSAATWLATANALYALASDNRDTDGDGTGDGVSVTAWKVRGDLRVDALAVDGTGTLYLATDGDVQVRSTEGTWSWYRLPGFTDVTEVRASAATADAWLGAGGALWHVADARFRPVDGMPALDGWTAAAGGDLWLLGGTGGLSRAQPRHHVSLVGIGAGTILAEAMDVSIEPDAVEHVVSVAARLDGVAAPVVEMAAVRRVALEPVALGAGRHVLEVTVAYDDGTLEALASRDFIAITAPLTWSADVRPIFEMRCARCHGPEGPSPTRLDGRGRWEAKIDPILEAVRSGRMPLGGPRLPVEEIGVIEAWAATGFVE